MSSTKIFSSSVGIAGFLLLVLSHNSPALARASGREDARTSQAQAQPRDPRSSVPRPASAREQELLAATAADPGKLAAWLELAQLQEARGATGEAESTFKAALSASAGSRDVILPMARFYNRTGQFDKAVAALEDAAAQTPSDPAGHQLVATHYWEKVQKDASLTAAEKLMDLDAGIAATDRALSQDAEYVEALTYKNILLRMKANLETDAARRAALIAEADALRSRAIALAKNRPAGTASALGAPPPPPPPPPPGFGEVDGQATQRVGGDIKPPTKIQHVNPVYPPEALEAGVAGLVILEAVIDTQGNVRQARVLRSITMLDEAALAAVREWRFTPTLLHGAPVPVMMTVTVNFVRQ